MLPVALMVLGALALFLIYCFVVLRIRGRAERKKEREQGLDHLRR